MTAFAIPRVRSTKPRRQPAAKASDRVSSYYVTPVEPRSVVRDAVYEARGSALLQTIQVGDVARSFFGTVVR